MRIALMGFAGINNEGSLPRLTLLTYKGLTELNNNVYIVSKTDLGSEFKYIKVRKMLTPFKKDVFTDIFSHYVELLKLSPQIYHMLYPHVSSTISFLFPSKFVKIVTIHDLKPIIMREFMNKKEKINISVINLTLKRVDRIIAVSKSTKEQILTYLNVKEDKVDVVYNPVDPIFKPLDKEVVAKTREKTGKFILNVSRFDKLKNPKNLIEAFKIIRKTRDVKLIVVGSYWNYAKKMISEVLGEYSKDVIIYEHVKDDELVKLYNASELLLFPSLYEGFDLPLVEAMSCGTPVVTSNRWSMKEIAEGIGLLVDPENPSDIAEKSLSILDNERLRYSMIEKGFEKSKQYDYLNISRRLIDIYSSTL
ncbi:glycosyltransferase family 1 protein [Acidianus sp. RZ1]|uniref:glycosyltransferase family 4 protein n=1 Tax=Acidianus sp. RZ1 TaxID=1540082 RepID=UPI001491F33A|nr:glycosyltransferase family 1 protein [Acidianus sp. RZ1]NON63038.1 glycosyltransferase family 4 protein [Acidianus sp. RZ1]